MPRQTRDSGARRVGLALETALRAHSGQFRKDGRTPYIVHPMGVVRHLVSDLGIRDPDLACVAALHDVLEDTSMRRRVLERRFGARVVQLVEALSLPAGLHGEAVPGAAKTHRLVADARTIPWEAVVVKLCDRWDNLRDVDAAPWGPAKRRYYAQQTRALLEAVEDRAAIEPPPKSLRDPIRRAISGVRAAAESVFHSRARRR